MLCAGKDASGGLVENRAACPELGIGSLHFQMVGQEGCEGLHVCSAGHFCLGVPGGNIVTKSIIRQCFYGKPVMGYQGLTYSYRAVACSICKREASLSAMATPVPF